MIGPPPAEDARVHDVDPDDPCECSHYDQTHPARIHTDKRAGKSGRCTGLDSYGQPCTCPSFSPIDSGIEYIDTPSRTRQQ